MTRHRLSVCDMSAFKRCPTQLNKCLWHHNFRMRNIATLLLPVYLCCLRVVTTCHKLSPLLTIRYRLGVLDMYAVNQPAGTILGRYFITIEYIVYIASA